MSSWKDCARSVVPYVPGEQPKLSNIIKLNTNENPYPPSEKAAQAIASFDPAILRKYPDPGCTELVQALAETYRVKPEQIFVGVGSDDVLATAFLAFFASDKPVLFPDVTYSFYDVWAELFGIPYERIPLDENLRIRVLDYEKENGGIIFPNPNAPTGIALSSAEIESLLRVNRNSAVIIDEAYVDFGAETVLPLLESYDNLLVVQTFSKSRSSAGLRIGFAIGSEEMAACLWAVRNSFNSYTLNAFAVFVGRAILQDDAYFRKTTAKIIETREQAKEKFRELGFVFGDSRANFLFVRHPEVPAEEIFRQLRERNVFVRHFGGERIKDYLRITIGTPEEMAVLFGYLKEILAASGQS